MNVGVETCLGVCRLSCFNALTEVQDACREVLTNWFGNHFSVFFFQATDVPALVMPSCGVVPRRLRLKSHTKQKLNETCVLVIDAKAHGTHYPQKKASAA